MDTRNLSQLASRPDNALEFLWLELTAKCNLRCVHCYADSGPGRLLNEGMEYRDWRRVLNDALALGCRSVQFIGGEATLHPALPELVLYARKLGFGLIEVFTNATALKEELLYVFVDTGVRLAVSVYSSEPEIHDLVTGVPGSQRRTLAGVKRAMDSGLAVRAAIIVMDENSSSVQETVRLLQELGVESIGIDRVRAVGRAQVSHTTEQFGELCGRCGDHSLCISSSGVVFPCIMSRFCRLGDFTDGLHNMIGGSQLKEFRRTLMGTTTSDTSCRPEIGGCRPTESCAPDTCTPTICGPRCAPAH